MKSTLRALLLGGLISSAGFATAALTLNSNEPSAEELATALGWSWWDFEVPEYAGEKFLTVRLMTASGLQGRESGGGMIKPGEKLRLFVGGFDQERIQYTLVGKNTVLRSSIPNKIRGFHFMHRHAGREIQLNQPFIKAAPEGASISGRDEVRNKEVCLVLTFE